VNVHETPTGYHAGIDDPTTALIPGVFVNPGAGPVSGANEENARANIAAFAEEIGTKWRAGEPGSCGGRWTFFVQGNGRECEVEMPGLPLASVRFRKEPGQNIWHFPRLYVDGGSWVWIYGVEIAREKLTS